MYYARVVFETNASAAERHDDVDAAQCWIERVRQSQPALFRLGQIFEGALDPTVVATCDLNGWHRPER
jgi:hypothetical protein